MRNGIAIIVSLLLSSTAFAQSTDTIYTKDGSIIKGEIVLQDFEKKLYKIKLPNGQLVTLHQEEITKISKSYESNNLPPEAQISSSAKNTNHTNLTANSNRKTLPTEWTIGLLRHTIKHDHNQYYNYTLKERFRGIRVSKRKIPNSYASFRMDFEVAKEDHIDSLFDDKDRIYGAVSAYVTIGKQRLTGLQVYAGAGAFISNYWSSGDDTFNLGLLGTSALGYRYQRASLLISGRLYSGTASSSSSNHNLDKIYSVSMDFALRF